MSDKRKGILLADFVADLLRRQESGVVVMPKNAGERRSISKEELLKAITRAGGVW